MKFKCAECESVFFSKYGETYDWRNKKKWYLSCPECGTELRDARNNDKITPIIVVKAILLVTLLFLAMSWFAYFRYKVQYGNEITYTALLFYLIYIGVSWYKHRNDKEEVLSTYTTNKKYNK